MFRLPELGRCVETAYAVVRRARTRAGGGRLHCGLVGKKVEHGGWCSDGGQARIAEICVRELARAVDALREQGFGGGGPHFEIRRRVKRSGLDAGVGLYGRVCECVKQEGRQQQEVPYRL